MCGRPCDACDANVNGTLRYESGAHDGTAKQGGGGGVILMVMLFKSIVSVIVGGVAMRTR